MARDEMKKKIMWWLYGVFVVYYMVCCFSSFLSGQKSLKYSNNCWIFNVTCSLPSTPLMWTDEFLAGGAVTVVKLLSEASSLLHSDDDVVGLEKAQEHNGRWIIGRIRISRSFISHEMLVNFFGEILKFFSSVLGYDILEAAWHTVCSLSRQYWRIKEDGT